MEDEEKKDRGMSPVVATMAAAVLGLAFNIVYNLAYQPSRRDIEDLQKRVLQMESDPRPKPETKVAVESIERRYEEMSTRQNRLEDRINNLHFFLLQTKPREAPFRKGDIPAFAEPPKL